MYVHNCHLLSFPTRRSSDLWRVDQVIVALETDGWFAQTSATPENTTAAYRRRTSETGDAPSVAGVVPSSDGLGSPSPIASAFAEFLPRTNELRVPAVYLDSAEGSFLAFLLFCRINNLRWLRRGEQFESRPPHH